SLKIGPWDDPDADMGPLVTQEHYDKVKGYVDLGVEEGAELAVDGRGLSLQGYEGGYFMGGSLFDRVTTDMRIYKEEIFGPVVSLIRFNNIDEAIDLINSRMFANAACLYTNSGKTAREFKYRILPAMIGINIGIAAPMSFFPFGGAGESMFGDIKGQGREIFQFYTDTKVTISRWL
ncbi:MAG: aldehyde dehydrogenase family protein, partial [Candidatus Latescibacteria bacterium]|nr:aldehyde dehydrogenase family protein [Candidatus Latescibacterota bacterium]